MSYQYYVQQEYDLGLLAMMEWVTFENELEDTANFFMSEPMVTDEILVRNQTIIEDEVTSLWLTSERTEPIRFANNVNFPSGNFTIITWVRAYEGDGTAGRGVYEFGPLSLSVVDAGAEQFGIRLDAGASNHTATVSTGAYMVMVVRDGDLYSMYIDNVLQTQLTVTGLTYGTSDVLIGQPGAANSDAELDVQGLTLFASALAEQEREDIWSIINTGAILRTVEAATQIDFESEEVRVLQTEWHSIFV